MADSQFARPELPQLIATIRSDLLTRFQQDVVLRRMDAEVYSRVQAAAVHTLYGYIDYLARNMLPDMCDEDWLYRHARIKRCPRKNAVSAKGFARWDGIAGTPEIPAGTQIQRDDQVTFTTLHLYRGERITMALQDEYTQLLYHLLPEGPAWDGENPLIEGLAPSLNRVHQRADELMAEIDPARTTELIDRYEQLYGLPDSCAPEGVQTLQQRQQRLDAKANVAGGINERFYREQLDALGYTAATIEQFQNLDSTPDPEWGEFWRYYWRVNIPADANISWQTCTSTCDSAIRTWGDTVAECVIDKLCPSHTVVVFAYPEGKENAQN